MNLGSLTNSIVIIPPIPSFSRLLWVAYNFAGKPHGTMPKWCKSEGDWIERGETICNFFVQERFLFFDGKVISIPIKSPVCGRIVVGKGIGGSGRIFNEPDAFPEGCTAMIQISENEQVPHTAEPVFAEFREKLLGNWKKRFGQKRFSYHVGSIYEDIDKETRELLRSKLLVRELNEDQIKKLRL